MKPLYLEVPSADHKDYIRFHFSSEDKSLCILDSFDMSRIYVDKKHIPFLIEFLKEHMKDE